MTTFENKEAMELNVEEMNEVAGGTYYKKLPAMEGFIVYKILPGDTLYKIAKIHHTTVDALMSYNPQITNRNLIRAGGYMYIRK